MMDSDFERNPHPIWFTFESAADLKDVLGGEFRLLLGLLFFEVQITGYVASAVPTGHSLGQNHPQHLDLVACSVERARPDPLVTRDLPPVDISVKILSSELTWESKATLLKERHDISPTGPVPFKCSELCGCGVSGREERFDPVTPSLSGHDAAHGQLLGADLKHTGMGEPGLISIRDLQASALADPLPGDGMPVRDPMKG
jgi:hypothetical protein